MVRMAAVSDDADSDDHGHRQREAGEAERVRQQQCAAPAAGARQVASQPATGRRGAARRRVPRTTARRGPRQPGWRAPNPRALPRRARQTTFVPRIRPAATTAHADHEPPARRRGDTARRCRAGRARARRGRCAPRAGRPRRSAGRGAAAAPALSSGETSPTRTMRARAEPHTRFAATSRIELK